MPSTPWPSLPGEVWSPWTVPVWRNTDRPRDRRMTSFTTGSPAAPISGPRASRRQPMDRSTSVRTARQASVHLPSSNNRQAGACRSYGFRDVDDPQSPRPWPRSETEATDEGCRGRATTNRETFDCRRFGFAGKLPKPRERQPVTSGAAISGPEVTESRTAVPSVRPVLIRVSSPRR
jgi:hypothetical protein